LISLSKGAEVVGGELFTTGGKVVVVVVFVAGVELAADGASAAAELVAGVDSLRFGDSVVGLAADVGLLCAG
jgi:hypothetical protein